MATPASQPTTPRTSNKPTPTMTHSVTISSQYQSFRSNPHDFPSFERLRFVKLDDALLPVALRNRINNKNSSNIDNNTGRDDNNANSTTLLTHHPCLLYNSIPELIRDAHLDTLTKHRLIMEHHRVVEKRRVGRLIGWRCENETAPRTSSGDKKSPVYFPDASVDLIRVSSSSEGNGTVLEFYEHLSQFEESCSLLEDEAASALNGGQNSNTMNQSEAREVTEYCIRWRNGVHFALNLLGMDLSGEVLPLLPTTTMTTKAVPPADGEESTKKKRRALGDIANTHKKVKSSTDVVKSTIVKQTTMSKQTTMKTAFQKIEPHTPWPNVWKILRSKGWTWRGGSGLMTDYYYILPGKKIKGGTVGVDYFVKVEDVQEYCRNEYGWVGSEDAVEYYRDDVKVEQDNVVAKTLKSDGGAPPLIAPLDPHTPWRSAWNTLLSSGWSWKAGSGLMTDYYYIKPHKKIKGGTVGVDYFVQREDLEEYMKVNYGWVGAVEEGKSKLTKGSVDCDGAAKKKKKKKSTGKTEKRDSLEFEDDEAQKNKKPKVTKIKVEKAEPKPSKTITVEESKAPVREEPRWKDLWAALKKEGWTVKTAGKYNPLHDWYYIRPGVDPADENAELGEHYFLEGQHVIDYCMNCRHDVVDALARENAEKAAAAQAAAEAAAIALEEANAKKAAAAKAAEQAAAIALEEARLEALRKPSWKEIWAELKKEGWRVESAGKYNNLHDWYYIRPGVNPADEDAELGEHYFLEAADVQEYLERNEENSDNADDTEAEDDVMDADGETAAEDDEVSDQSDDEQTPVKPQRLNLAAAKKALWKQLKEEGWTVEKASKWNKLHDWYWIRPWVDPGSSTAKLGVDYFLSLDDVYEFVNGSTNDEADEFDIESTSNANDDSILKEKPPRTIVDWKSLWAELKEEGWDIVRAGKYNRLHDWYYLRPGVDPGSEESRLGEDYFLSSYDVIDFVESSGYKNEEVKVDDDQDDTSANEDESPKTNVDWTTLWAELKEKGWGIVSAVEYNHLHDYDRMHDWYYLRPGVDPGNEESRLGEDYFLTWHDVRDYVMSSGYKSEESEVEDDQETSDAANTPLKSESIQNKPITKPRSISGPQTPDDCQTKPQDPAIPLPSSPESSTASDSEDSFEWHNLWQRLKMAGWRCVNAGKYNKLHDVYYVRPGRDPSDDDCVLGRHYFMSQDDVIQFERMREDEENEAKKKSERESMDAMQVIFEKEAEVEQI